MLLIFLDQFLILRVRIWWFTPDVVPYYGPTSALTLSAAAVATPGTMTTFGAALMTAMLFTFMGTYCHFILFLLYNM
jgi:hypothetical protein